MRDAFLLDRETIFLNHGSYGACPAEVLARQQAWQLEMERNPVEFLGRRSGQLLAEARAALAHFLHTSPDDLVFVPNATTGVNTVARSLKLQPGDEVLTTDHEYGACDAAWRFVCGQAGAHYRAVEVPLPYDATRWVQRLLDAIGPRTRLIYASHIASTTALIFPVADLCAAARARGVPTLIDGAHAPGQIALDIDAVGADFYTGNCHKWMCAPKGSAFLHARPERQAELDATVVSWGYLDDAIGGHGWRAAYTGSSLFERRMQWQGTRDIAAFLSVPAAIDFQARHDWPEVQRRCHAMACETAHRVAARNRLPAIATDGAFGQMAIIPVRIGDGVALGPWLFARHRIEVPVTTHAGQSFVRVSVQAYNTQADLDALVAALAEAGV